jgi:pilus assembly protein Flp/PilA
MTGIAHRRSGVAQHKERMDMKQLAHIVGAFWRDEDGQDLLEYALLVALIALIAVGGVTAAGLKVNDIFQAIVAAIPLP